MYEVRGRGASGETTGGQLGEDESYSLKPMNCPGHCLLFNIYIYIKHRITHIENSFSVAEFSPFHRNEISGSLSGLTRVRAPRRRTYILSTTTNWKRDRIGLEICRYGYAYFWPRSIQTCVVYEAAEGLHWQHQALQGSGRALQINEGDGAFYGPKIDRVQDSDGAFHQVSTIQLDVNLPDRFGLEYAVAAGEEDYNPLTPGKAMPVMIHRAVFGSLERFYALLIEHYGGGGHLCTL